jgi:hypothetical protein
MTNVAQTVRAGPAPEAARGISVLAASVTKPYAADCRG